MKPAIAGQHASPIYVDFRARARQPAKPTVVVRLSRSRGWLIVEVEGEVDLLAGWFIPDLVDCGALNVVFDLRAVTSMEACALGMLVETQRQAVAAGGCVRLVAPSQPALRCLKSTRLEHAFPVFDSIEQAVLTPLDPIGDDAS